jgi:hypothetical protein
MRMDFGRPISLISFKCSLIRSSTKIGIFFIFWKNVHNKSYVSFKFDEKKYVVVAKRWECSVLLPFEQQLVRKVRDTFATLSSLAMWWWVRCEIFQAKELSQYANVEFVSLLRSNKHKSTNRRTKPNEERHILADVFLLTTVSVCCVCCV